MSRIEWTDKTWNVITGCTQVSPACENCYAKAITKRLQGMARKHLEQTTNFKCKECEFDFQDFVWIAFVAWLVVTALIFIFIADPNQAEKSLIRVLLMQIGTLVLFIGIAFVAFVATHKIPSKKEDLK